MANTASAVTPLPRGHIQSLQNIENAYWWYIGRLNWAVEIIRSWFGEQTEKNLDYIDLGCGTGGFAKAIKNTFSVKKAAVVDGDPQLVQKLSRTHNDFEILQTNLNQPFQLPWQPSLVTCMDVLEHLENDKHFLGLVAGSMRPKGLLLVSVPAHQVLYSEWDRQLGHYRRYSRSDLESKLNGAGLKIRLIRHMWSFMIPFAPYRLLAGQRYRKNMEFEKVPSWINSLLVGLSKMEWRLPRSMRLPFGTSLIAAAEKP
ncbi:MAG: class I SAM-dependent methyltransferase [Deltaproteobacteria bacterium]|nr:class I SAM-dependent methyltransferase [Deltaproteobacteria bacterium]